MVSTVAFQTRGSFPGLGGLKETKMFLPHPLVKLTIVGNLCDREVGCSASDFQGLNFESCVWKAVSSHSFHHPQEVLLAQFSLNVHKSSLKPDSFYCIFTLISDKQHATCNGKQNVNVRHRDDCSKYYVCDSDLEMTEMSCPEGKVFNIKGKFSDPCVEESKMRCARKTPRPSSIIPPGEKMNSYDQSEIS